MKQNDDRTFLQITIEATNV